MKHAGAQPGPVSSSTGRAAAVRLRIEDDGKGFDPAAVPDGHLGLAGMRARADQIGATFEVPSRAGVSGTTIDVLVPKAVSMPSQRLAPLRPSRVEPNDTRRLDVRRRRYRPFGRGRRAARHRHSGHGRTSPTPPGPLRVLVVDPDDLFARPSPAPAASAAAASSSAAPATPTWRTDSPFRSARQVASSTRACPHPARRARLRGLPAIRRPGPAARRCSPGSSRAPRRTPRSVAPTRYIRKTFRPQELIDAVIAAARPSATLNRLEGTSLLDSNAEPRSLVRPARPAFLQEARWTTDPDPGADRR